MIIFIDWISTPDHASFNQALFEVLRLENARCFVFDDALITNAMPCQKVTSNEGRFGRFKAVRRICEDHPDDQIFFISYDPVLIPFLEKRSRNCIAFEHNTVPEGGLLTKHGLWQWLFFHRIFRMSQFPAQHEMLIRMGQKSFFVGSPILTDRFECKAVDFNTSNQLLVPSFRAQHDEIEKIAKLAQGAEIVVKQAAIEGVEFPEGIHKRLTAVDRIELDNRRDDILGIAITVTSRIRGTGWFNDAISRGIPLLMSNTNATKLFMETFPGMPFTEMSDIKTSDDLRTKLQSQRATTRYEQILQHNEAIRARFFHACKSIGWKFS